MSSVSVPAGEPSGTGLPDLASRATTDGSAMASHPPAPLVAGEGHSHRRLSEKGNLTRARSSAKMTIAAPPGSLPLVQRPGIGATPTPADCSVPSQSWPPQAQTGTLVINVKTAEPHSQDRVPQVDGSADDEFEHCEEGASERPYSVETSDAPSQDPVPQFDGTGDDDKGGPSEEEAPQPSTLKDKESQRGKSHKPSASRGQRNVQHRWMTTEFQGTSVPQTPG